MCKELELELELVSLLESKGNISKEKSLIRKIRELDESVSYDLLMKYLSVNTSAVLDLFQRTLMNKKYYRRLFFELVYQADASSVDYLIEMCIKRMSFNALMTLIYEVAKIDKIAAEKCLFWIPKYVESNDTLKVIELNRATEKIKNIKNY